jgi:inner membrane protein
MPTILSHAIAAAAVTSPTKPKWKLVLVAALCAMLPDADVLAFTFGIPYSHMFGHRGFSHSLFFAAVVAVLCTYYVRQSDKEAHFGKTWLVLFLAMASHGVLDAMTSGGLGIAFFAPFSAERYFLPWRPIQVSPIGMSRFFSPRGIAVLSSELIWVWIPSGMIPATVALFNGRQLFTRRDAR